MQSTTNMLRRDLFLEFKLGFSVGLIFLNFFFCLTGQIAGDLDERSQKNENKDSQEM